MTTKKQTLISRLHPNIWVLSAGSYLTDVSSEMLFNLLPLFLFNVLGVRTSIVGLIEGIAETTSSFFKIYSGSLSDRLGRRKSLTVLGYALSTVAKPLLYFATSWAWVLGIRFSDRVGKGIRTAPRDALLAGSADASHRGLAFGLHRAADTAGAFTGMAIAALVIWATQADTTVLTRETFQKITLISIVPAALAVIVLAVWLREAAPAQAATSSGARASFSASWKAMEKPFKLFLIVIVLFTLGNSSDAFIILRAQERGLSVLQIMGMLLTFTAIYSLLSGPAGSLSDRIGRRKVLLAGWLIYGLVYLGFAAAEAGWQVWALYGLYGIYYAMTEGVAKALIADLVSPERRGTAYGLFNGAIGLTALPASLFAGILWQGIGGWRGFGPPAPFYFGAALALVAGGLLVYLVREADR
ncbi:MAG: MFS transporter [Chloroflexota bacterium]|nr:MAG: MFS transporter [Chloroflexota bacterium]